MADRRTRKEKLTDMARDTSSPNEAAIARRMLGTEERSGRKTQPKPEFDS